MRQSRIKTPNDHRLSRLGSPDHVGWASLIAVLVSVNAVIADGGEFVDSPSGTLVWGGVSVHEPAARLPVASDSAHELFRAPRLQRDVDAPFEESARLASQSIPQYMNQPIVEQDPFEHSELNLQQLPAGPPGAREGVFQKAAITGTWLPRLGDDNLGFADVDAYVVLGFPFPRRDAPIVITPSFGAHYLDGPNAPDLPPRLYDAAIEWRHMRQLNPCWAMDVAVTTGYYSDFNSDEDAFRVSGRGLAVYDWSPITKVVFGVAYLNRAGATVLPVGGLIVTPNDSVRYELIAPRPRVAWRLDGWSCPDVDEYWFYVAGEFGGGAWAYERADGSPDVLYASDYRALLGIEHKQPGYFNSRVEVGYVFGREIEFDSATPNYDPGDTLFVRYGATY